VSSADDFLVEIGTEELPPKALRSLMEAFGEKLTSAVDDAGLSRGATSVYASPRRLCVYIDDLQRRQDDRKVERKGPPTKIAFDDDGKPTPAATAFAKKCGVAVAELGREKTEKGEWLSFSSVEPGLTAAVLMPTLIEQALAALPIPRRMRWGKSETEFVRPVHWIVMLHGDDSIQSDVMGIEAGNTSRGHRFHSAGAVRIASAADYLGTLEREGFVIADFNRRRELVRSGVGAAAAEAGGQIVEGESLYDEVAALVEWPVPVLGSFDKSFLSLPREVVISTLTGHQRYFPVADTKGDLLPRFITVANIESKDPNQVRDGNERVIRPRLADAAFFWETDRKKTLAGRQETLREVVYQRGLGSLFDKSQRVATLSKSLAEAIGADKSAAVRAAELAKCDLLTGSDGEAPEVATAIGEQYQPRFAGDALPASDVGQALAVADKIDTLAGVFSLGKKPSGNRDPFGLRRAALGIIRILVECGLDIDLKELIAKAIALQPESKLPADELSNDLYAFISDRLRRYFLDRDTGLATETFEAVMLRHPASLVDFDRRLAAVQTFLRLEQAESLAAANKRIANILRKAGNPDGLRVDRKLLEEDAERALQKALDNVQEKVAPMLKTRSYAEVLNELADLRDPIDLFFDDVMVMAEDEAVRNNRLALLGELRTLFLRVADISRLSLGG